jgi:hypothetical protein
MSAVLSRAMAHRPIPARAPVRPGTHWREPPGRMALIPGRPNPERSGKSGQSISPCPLDMDWWQGPSSPRTGRSPWTVCGRVYQPVDVVGVRLPTLRRDGRVGPFLVGSDLGTAAAVRCGHFHHRSQAGDTHPGGAVICVGTNGPGSELGLASMNSRLSTKNVRSRPGEDFGVAPMRGGRAAPSVVFADDSMRR